MGKKIPTLALSMPTCRNCGRAWRPAEGVSAAKAYCSKCSGERRAAAAAVFDLRPIPRSAVVGDRIIPRARWKD